MVADPQALITLRARPLLAARVPRPRVHSAGINVQLDPLHRPRLLRSRKALVQLGVSHQAPLLSVATREVYVTLICREVYAFVGLSERSPTGLGDLGSADRFNRQL